MAYSIEAISNWSSRLLGRLYAQFAEKPNFTGFIGAVAPQMQELETCVAQMLTLFSISSSTNIQLDNIGKIVGELRGGLSDANYRLRLKARIAANLSRGTPPDLLAVMVALFGASVDCKIIPMQTASVIVRLHDVMTPTSAAYGLSFTRDAKAAGVQGIFEWQEYSDALSLYTDTCCCLTLAAIPGSMLLTVDSTAAFPASGSAIINEGLAGSETVTFTVFSPTQLTTSALAGGQDNGSRVSLVGALNLGLGLGDATDPAVGGYLVGAED